MHKKWNFSCQGYLACIACLSIPRGLVNRMSSMLIPGLNKLTPILSIKSLFWRPDNVHTTQFHSFSKIRSVNLEVICLISKIIIWSSTLLCTWSLSLRFSSNAHVFLFPLMINLGWIISSNVPGLTTRHRDIAGIFLRNQKFEVLVSETPCYRPPHAVSNKSNRFMHSKTYIL